VVEDGMKTSNRFARTNLQVWAYIMLKNLSDVRLSEVCQTGG